MSAAAPRYRFVPEPEALTRFFTAYQAARRSIGIGTTLEHVTAQQRIDAITLILGLNASDGWRRIGAEGPKALWLRYLKPVLAETRESALALEAALERGELPGTFDPPFAELEPPPPPPQPQPLPPYPQVDSEHLARRAAAEARRNWLRSPRVVALLCAVLLLAAVGAVALLVQRGLITMPGASQGTSAGGGNAIVIEPVRVAPYASPVAIDDTSLSKPISERARDAYLRAVTITNTAIGQTAVALTPRVLAQIFAGESDVVDEPGIFLAAMLDQAPAEPDLPLALNSSAGTMLRDYAAVAASIESGIPESDFADLIQDPNDPALSIDPPAANADVVTAVAGSATWPAWLRYLAFLPLLPALAWSVASLPRAMKAGLRNAAAGAKGAPVNLPAGMLSGAAPSAPRRLARRLTEREAFAGRRLHSERTVNATLAAGGFPTIVMRPAMRTVDFVFLVARHHRHDHERDRAMRLIDALKRGGVPLFVYDYDPDPRSVMPVPKNEEDGANIARTRPRLDLRALRELHGDARLVLVTDGRELVDFFTRRPLPLVEELRAWSRIMLLTPVPVADWGEREMNLSEALDARIGRATEEGFADLAEMFRPRTVRRHRLALGAGREAARAGTGLVGRVFAWLTVAVGIARPDPIGPRPESVNFDDPALTSDAQPPEAYQAAVIGALRDWLGRPGFFWLAACAAYPQTRFNITLYLGLALTFTTRSGPRPLYQERSLAQIASLPWFRTGRMPLWLRRRLFESLGPATRQRVLEAVDALLAGRPLADARGASRIDLTIWRPENRALDIPPDAVMADMMLTERTDLVPILAGERFREVFQGPLRRILLRRFGLLGVTALWCLAAWWLAPDPATAPAAPGAWLPLLTLVAVTMLVLALFGVARLLGRMSSLSARPAAAAPREMPNDEAAVEATTTTNSADGRDDPSPITPSEQETRDELYTASAPQSVKAGDGEGEERRWK